MIYGSMLHNIFERALRYNQFETEALEGHLEELIQKNIENLYALFFGPFHMLSLTPLCSLLSLLSL